MPRSPAVLPRLPRVALPPPGWALAVFAAIFILPGLAGHDPWKSQDAIGLGIAHQFLQGGELLYGRVAGLRWMHDPPLYHWIAAAFGAALQWGLEFHAAARLASGAFVAAAFWLVYRAARDWSEEGEARTAASAALLILLGSVGLMVHAHEALPELAALAAVCGAFAALPHATQRPRGAGAAFGAALGLAFLAAGWISPAAVALAALLAAALSPQLRTRAYAAFLGIGLALACALGGAWLLALGLKAPDALAEWWRLASAINVPVLGGLRQVLGSAGWFAWPAWPLALWALWSHRRKWREPQLLVPALAALAMVALQARWGYLQQENLILLLAPLALLGCRGIFRLRRGALAAFDWFGVLTFGFFTALVWLGYVAMQTGFPPRVEYSFARTAPGFAPQFSPFAFAAALALVALWLYLVFFSQPSPARSVMRWAAGVVLLWASFALLWMPWVDHQKSYRSVALQLRQRLPVQGGCIAQRALGVPQAAALDYHGGIRARPFDLLKPEECRLLLVQGSPRHEHDAPPAARWTKLADLGRPGDKAERFRLYQLRK